MHTHHHIALHCRQTVRYCSSQVFHISNHHMDGDDGEDTPYGGHSVKGKTDRNSGLHIKKRLTFVTPDV